MTMENTERLSKLHAFLEGLYYTYARRELIYPDPLYFLRNYSRIQDVEIAALIASSLAYGRVAMIMRNVEFVLSKLGTEPAKFLLQNHNHKIIPENFKHRFTDSYDVNNLLANITQALKNYGSIEKLLRENLLQTGDNLLEALNLFSDFLNQNRKAGSFPLITAPRDGSACKRLFLFLKWLVRHDDVDPGGWEIISPAKLLVPVDTHMHNISLKLGFTRRKTADLKAAIEITQTFAKICPEDPTKYDFVLTRFGIRDGLEAEDLAELFDKENFS